MIFHPRWSHEGCPVRATGGALPCGRYLLASLTGNEEGSRSLMVLLWVKPTPTRFPTDNLYIPSDNTHLHSITSAIGVRPIVRVCESQQFRRNAAVDWKLSTDMEWTHAQSYSIFIYCCLELISQQQDSKQGKGQPLNWSGGKVINIHLLVATMVERWGVIDFQ